jgi:hypothetical protein
MKLMKVQGNGCHLQWPVPPFPEEHRSRGGQGYVVDADHPLEKGYDEPALTKEGVQRLDPDGRPLLRHVNGWCEGQLHKLEPAPEAKGPSPINLPAARIALADFEAARAPKPETPAPTPTAQTKASGYGRKPREPVQTIEGG